MIKNEFITIKVSSGLKQNYSGLGYDFTKDEVSFKITDLKKSSNQKIDVICDICGEEYNIQYTKYIKNFERNGLYSCKKCALKKRSKIMTENNLSLNKKYQKKKKETWLKKYGVDNPSKSDKIKKKKKETCLKNHGVDNGLKLRDKVREGMIDKYGIEHALQSDDIKSKMRDDLISLYGVDNVSKLLDIKIKKKETCFKNYGVYNPSQSKYIFEKMLISAYKLVYYNDELYAQGSYELDFLNYCKNNNILDLISNGPSIDYELDGKKHTYHSDFYIEKFNLIIEIKSNYTYNYHLSKNLAKEKYSKLNGYDFLFIIDKNYDTINEKVLIS